MKHSTYFDGKVQSLGMNTAQGYATVGVIEPGTYTFSTSKEETMFITEGALEYLLPHKRWEIARKGEQFIAPAGVSFECKAENDVSYICYYK
jgi:purine/pyrimidine-nucleoside phosphorylase